MTAKPNVLIIYSDQHRADCLGAYGNREVLTPNLDALAAEGVTFENSFCSFPVCTPSRYSFLSGQWVWHHAGWSNHCTLAPEIETFPRFMAREGYRTSAVGKMHFTPTYLDVGFERMELCEQNGPGRWDDDYHRELMAHGLVDLNDLEDQCHEYRDLAGGDYWDSFGAMPSNLPEERHSTTWIGQRAVKRIDEWDAGGGNLLMAGFVKPHHPFDPPKEWLDLYDPETLTLLPGWLERPLDRDMACDTGYFPHERLTERALRGAMAAYYATISQIDHWVGEMIARLKQRGLYDNTIVVYTADHGDYMGFHHMLLKSNHMYDPLMRVPLIARVPGGARGARRKGLVSCVDFAPSVLRAVGIEPPKSMTGIDILADNAGRDVVLGEAGRGQSVMARSTTHKLLLDSGKEMLFDLRRDPFEVEDVSGDPAQAEALASLREAARVWRDASMLPPLHLDERAPRIEQPNVPDLDDGHRERIEAWYWERARELRG